MWHYGPLTHFDFPEIFITDAISLSQSSLARSPCGWEFCKGLKRNSGKNIAMFKHLNMLRLINCKGREQGISINQ